MTTLTIYKLAISSCFIMTFAMTGCQSPATATNPNVLTNETNTQNSASSPVYTDTSQQTITQQALHIQSALANKNYSSIINDIHPTRGVRFSMYAYVRPESDKVFSRAQFEQYLQQSKIRFTWGDLDGTGELLVTTLPTYLRMWVQAHTFNNTPMSINKVKPTGNMINNVEDIYPQADVVDFYRKGSDKYSGMDWRVLRLVFDEYQGKRYLVAIISDQWTV